MSVYRTEDGTLAVGITEDALNASLQLSIVIAVANGIDTAEVEKLERELGLAQTTQPIFDPTGFMRDGDKTDSTRRIASAFLEFRRVIDEEKRKAGPMLKTRTVPGPPGTPPRAMPECPCGVAGCFCDGEDCR